MYVVLTTKGEEMDHKLLENSPLFKDVAPEEIDAMLQCLGTEEKEYEKGEIIFLSLIHI